MTLTFLEALLLAGCLLLTMGLSSAYVRRLPISTAAIYLALGIVLGPIGFGVFDLRMSTNNPAFERVTEIAVIISLFIGGLRLRQPLRSDAWSAVLRLAGPVMLCCIALGGVAAHLLLRLEWPAALLLGAILAPTDPVLASAVSVSKATDDDRVRYGLSGEAGLNDGMAFPFVVLALAWMEHQHFGEWTVHWALHRLLWAVPAGLLFGFFVGRSVGRLAVWLRSHQRDAHAPTDFLALALIFLSYVGAETIEAWGFLATFAAGVGLRSAELKVVSDTPHPEISGSRSVSQAPEPHPPAEDLVPAMVSETHLKEPAVAAGVLVAETITFGETAERLLEVSLVVLIGASLHAHWDMRAIPLAFLLFVIIRPLSANLSLHGTATNKRQRWLLGWFGVRGIGSLYYLAYALHHGLHDPIADVIADLTISVIAISIVVHGVTAQPLFRRYERAAAA
jgi:sodium/hydrogen antiporter